MSRYQHRLPRSLGGRSDRCGGIPPQWIDLIAVIVHVVVNLLGIKLKFLIEALWQAFCILIQVHGAIAPNLASWQRSLSMLGKTYILMMRSPIVI
ncbi:hypothetical protein [Chroococcidiopsis sp. SAG 2025]|uniref:hypothetical protein n=1 Tax=Chroococcidiopsis sp. SAG 2025 TaxID=171389 RepID=UPI002936FBDE|nr:hypothetical protein [Chroococcidiopsis sp. SAG 2025]